MRAWEPYAAALVCRYDLVFEKQLVVQNSSDGGYGPQTNALNFFGAFSGETRLFRNYSPTGSNRTGMASPRPKSVLI